MALLEVRGAQTGYSRARILNGIDLSVNSGEILAIAGPNGAGKSTLLKMIAGILPFWKGTCFLKGEDIKGFGAEGRIRAGIVLCPEGRRIFGSLSVEENLQIGATTLWQNLARAEAREAIDEGLAVAYDMFPILRERRNSSGNALSGGQQQMLAIARALMARPSVLLLDEPSLGLAPQVSAGVYEHFGLLRNRGLAIILVEESAMRATRMADYALVLTSGNIALEGTADSVRKHPDLSHFYLGGGGDTF